MIARATKPIAEFIKVRTAEELAGRYEENSAGIYAWHIPGPTEKTRLGIDEINNYYASLSDAITKEALNTPRSTVTISINKTPIKSSIQAQSSVTTISDFIDLVGLFSYPVYVGMTAEQGISARIRQHLSQSGFNAKMMGAIEKSGFSDNIYLESMLIRYFPVDEFLAARGLILAAAERLALIEQIEQSIFSCRMPPLNDKRSK